MKVLHFQQYQLNLLAILVLQESKSITLYTVTLNSVDLLRDVWIPQTNDSVHPASDDDVLVFREVKTLDPLVDVEYFLISIQPHSGVGFLGLFCIGVPSLVHSGAS